MDLKNNFIDIFDNFLSNYGFNLDDDGSFFFKEKKEVTYAIVLGISSYGERFVSDPGIFVKCKEIEKVRKNFKGKPFKGKYYYTVITKPLWLAEHFRKSDPRILDFILKDETTVKSSIESFEGFMIESGFPFFDQFNCLGDFDKWFNEPVIQGTYDFKKGDLKNDATEGLIAAKLNKNPNYEELYQIWVEKLIADGKYSKTIEMLHTLKEHLDGIKVKNDNEVL